MKNNKIFAYFLLCTIIFWSACTDKYGDYNTDTIGGATDEELERDGYAINSSLLGMGDYVVPTDVNLNQFVECLLGGSFGGYLADSNDGFNGKNFSTYNPEEHWLQVTFNDIIPAISIRSNDLKQKTNDPIILAVSDVIKVMALSKVTDVYGPMPYSKIGLDGALAAPYDSQEEIYNHMFDELDNAITVLTNNRMVNFTSRADNVYNGNVINWIKLANSMKLRLAMRIANVKPDLARTKATEAANHEIGTISSNADNAWKPAPGKNPFRVVMYEYNDGDSRVSADITSYMNGYKDPRCEKYFTQSTFSGTIVNAYHGLRSGIQIPGGSTVKLYSNMVVQDNTKLLWMNAAEVAFLKAEGALRGWNMGDTAEGFYNRGITLSFEQWGASGANQYIQNDTDAPAAYIDPIGFFSYTGTPSNVTIKWDAGATQEKNLERIITQKWIAIFPLGIEAWSEYRRTGYPKLMEILRNNSGGKVSTERMARRLPYPQKEYLENSENLEYAINNYLKGQDNMGTDVWWAKKQ